jgi:hypothetical protein
VQQVYWLSLIALPAREVIMEMFLLERKSMFENPLPSSP